MLQNIELILAFFLLFYFLILFYDFSVVFFRKSASKLDSYRRIKLEKIIKASNTKLLIRKLRSLNYLYVFNQMIDENNEEIVSFLNKENAVIERRLTRVYMYKDNLSKAYFSYTLSKVKVSSYGEEFLLKMMSSNSIYCIEDSLKALYHLKNPDLLVRAFKKLSRNKVHYSDKLITDGILGYDGDKAVLSQKLYENFSKFSTICKIGFINYFRYILFDIGDEIIFSLKNESLEKELEIAMIRYFTKVKRNEAYELFIERLENNYYNDFEYEVVMIQALGNYNCQKTIDVLTKKLSDFNYYIRYNSCLILDKLTDIRKLRTDDGFAKDMINYILDER